MMSEITAHPLCWPEGQSRTSWVDRRESQFAKRSREKAIQEMVWEVERLGGEDLIISSMLKLRQDGLPYSTQPRTDDPGIAVYFTKDGKPLCFACDNFAKDVENIWAIKLTIEALRGIGRWGASNMMEQAFTGFAALPPRKHWSEVMNLPRSASLDQIKATYRDLAKMRHPDVPGGSEHLMVELNAAWEQVKEEWELTS